MADRPFDQLRRPFLVIAFLVALVVVLIEVGSSAVLGGGNASASFAEQVAEFDDVDASPSGSIEEPSGHGIPSLALVDGIVAYTLGLMVLSLVLSDRALGRVQGVVTLLLSLFLLIGAIVFLIIVFVELLVMIALFLAAPFGTIAYLALWGTFPKGDAAAVLSLLLFLKLVCAVLLVVAQQDFLRQKRLVLLLLISMGANIVVSFLHGIVPGILVSITDAVAAIIVTIIAIIWAIVLLVGSIISIVAAVRVTVSNN